MTNTRKTGKLNILFVTAITLIVLVVVTNFCVFMNTLASYASSHVLTYTTGSLTWDEKTETDENGSAKLSIFNNSYENSDSSNGDKIVAPGTENNTTVSLRNTTDRAVQYTAVAYIIKENDDLNITADMSSDGATELQSYTLPADADNAKILKALTGEISANNENVFNINWKWDFEDVNNMETQDSTDTALGDYDSIDNAEDVTIRFYVTIEDNGSEYESRPDTGDSNYTILLAVISVLALITAMLLLISLKKRRKE